MKSSFAIEARTSSHFVLEHLDHAVVGAGAADLSQHVVKFALVHELSDVVEGSSEVVLVDGAILVNVHEEEALLVHVQLLLREAAIVTPEMQMRGLYLVTIATLPYCL